MSSSSPTLDLLPPRLREIADVVGVDAALALAAAVGGVRLYVPKVMQADHPIAKAIGFDKARLISEAFGLDYFSLPMGARAQGAVIRQRVLERYYGGESAAKVARDYGLHEQTVYKWASTEKQEMASQASLF